MPALLAAALLAAAAPKVAYKPDPASVADVATVNLVLNRYRCFGIVRASVLLSSRKSDRTRLYVLSVTVADTPAPATIQSAEAGGAPLKLVNIRNGDVACTEYQCPTGSAAVFELPEAQHAAARAAPLAIKVRTTVGADCGPDFALEPQVFEALDAWAERLPAPKG